LQNFVTLMKKKSLTTKRTDMNDSKAIIITSIKRVFTLLSSFLLATTFHASAHLVPILEDKSLPENRELSETYQDPMTMIFRFIRNAHEKCERLPSKAELNDFVLNGRHSAIKCSSAIETYFLQRNMGHKIGRELPYLSEFLKLNQYQVHSDTKNFFFILKQNSSEWKYKHFKSEDYEYVIHCIHGLQKCVLVNLNHRAESCRSSKTFSKNCYFGNKKVIDY
jgi:hypothetical protein